MPTQAKDIEYARPAGPAAPLLPARGSRAIPAVLEVHAGASTSGDRLNNSAISDYLIALHEFKGDPHAFIARAPNSADSQRALALIADFIHHQIG